MTGDVPPRRVVDGYGKGWHFTGSGTYDVDYGPGDLPLAHGPARVRDGAAHGTGWTLAELQKLRGPVRPVVPLPAERLTELVQVLTRAEERAAASVLCGLYTVRVILGDTDCGVDMLVAGRPGSWESVTAAELADQYGPALITARGVWDEHAAPYIAGMLSVWVCNPGAFVEVAENLAVAFGRATDAAGGWDQVADGYLRQDERLRNLLTSTSEGYWRDR